MTVVDSAPQLTPGASGRMAAGVAGGLAGGVVFGVVMQLGGTLPMVAQLVGRESLLVGWTVHMSIAAFVGLTFALIFGFFAVGPPVSTLLGAFYGLIWWVLGGLTLMPLRLGLGLFVFDSTAWESLLGHLAYGCVLGVLYVAVGHLLLGVSARRRGGTVPALPPPDPGAPAAAAPAAGQVAAPAAPPPPAGLLGTSQPAALPLERRPAPAPSAQPSILEFVLPPAEAGPPPPAAPAAADLAALSQPEPWAPWQHASPPDAPDSTSGRPDGGQTPGLKPWEVRQHRG